jgi:cytochrome c oxidase assembly protein subunit 15
LAGLVALQAITGISNVVLDWPLLAAVLHTGGAAALVAVLVWLLTITCAQPAVERELVLTRRLTE